MLHSWLLVNMVSVDIGRYNTINTIGGDLKCPAGRRLGGAAEQYRVFVVVLPILQRTLHVSVARLVARFALHFDLLRQGFCL